MDLRRAVAATVTLEKVLSHEDSRDLRISINGNAPIPVPEPAPANWVTRADTFSQTFTQPLDVDDIDAYKLHWTS